MASRASKQLEKLPAHIKTKFEYWCDLIRFVGILEARKYRGFHDEPLKGKRQGQRSVRLSKAYRVIYIEQEDALNLEIDVLEVNKHEY